MGFAKKTEGVAVIKPENYESVKFFIVGKSQLVVERFSKKMEMLQKMIGGTVAKNNKNRPAKDPDKEFEEAKYISEEGWEGMNAAAFRNAIISACKIANYAMTKAKLSIFIEEDGVDLREDGTPLVRIYGAATQVSMTTRNATGVADVRTRPHYKKWGCVLRIEYDADQFDLDAITNLLSRAGNRVGIGAGRPDSKKSNGLGFGRFRIAESEEDFWSSIGIEPDR